MPSLFHKILHRKSKSTSSSAASPSSPASKSTPNLAQSTSSKNGSSSRLLRRAPSASVGGRGKGEWGAMQGEVVPPTPPKPTFGSVRQNGVSATSPQRAQFDTGISPDAGRREEEDVVVIDPSRDPRHSQPQSRSRFSPPNSADSNATTSTSLSQDSTVVPGTNGLKRGGTLRSVRKLEEEGRMDDFPSPPTRQNELTLPSAGQGQGYEARTSPGLAIPVGSGTWIPSQHSPSSSSLSPPSPEQPLSDGFSRLAIDPRQGSRDAREKEAALAAGRAPSAAATSTAGHSAYETAPSSPIGETASLIESDTATERGVPVTAYSYAAQEATEDPLAALEEHRRVLSDRLHSEISSNSASYPILTDEGQETFKRAGMDGLVGTPGTVDIQTRWLEPVIQEHTRPQVHTEYTTVIDRHIIHHHTHPKIQPVEDPSPTTQPPKHRIFSPQTNSWHELSPASARLVLGDDVFFNGPQEAREERFSLLPGFGKMLPADEGRWTKDAGGEWVERPKEKVVYEDVPGGEEEGEGGYRWGRGNGKVWEREYPLGATAEEKGDWKDVLGLRSGKSGMSEISGGLPRSGSQSVGVAL
ncbi:hypothetical protein L202_07163 [Cryptococcus amylolentus CBS 6039]|uniref:Uncharacterized protein n=1 Tax=Cryptococcus amylolentus CBS 6039 TaxID=1295533 RepID=A0A1E3HES6_9TREE|nr:hypothetical protein L202_07163 [Cryptococcus amylolentus CBS 6039]ODN74859.1 hypothetical protein L202_07163 [Cryptococcus amylolentus CBS 6039]